MISKWYKLKNKAVEMRLSGKSIREIENEFKIPKSTLSNWFKNLKLSTKHQKNLKEKWEHALVKARVEAVKWHNNQKNIRVKNAEDEASKIIEEIDLKNKQTMELALAMLYLGEGFKGDSVTGIGNSNPMILKFFIIILSKLYAINTNSIKCHLHLRADQSIDEMKSFWSNKLEIPIENFGKTSIDKRTVGSKTYDTYKGVCVLKCGNVAIQRKLLYLSRIYCERIISSLGG